VVDKSTNSESIMTAHRLSEALRAAVVRRADAFALTLCAAVPRVITVAHGDAVSRGIRVTRQQRQELGALARVSMPMGARARLGARECRGR
jgi:hypothetical protein